MKTQRLLAGLAGLAMALAACGGAGSPAASTPPPSSAAAKPAASASSAKPAASGLEPVIQGRLAGDAFQWADLAAQNQGLYTKNGLALETITLGTPAVAAQAITSGSVNITAASADAFIQAIEGGAPLVMIGQEIGDPAFTVMTQPGIKSWNELKGATVAVSNATDGAANVFRLMAKQKGLEAQKDYSFVPVGTTPARYAALKANQVKAAIMTQALALMAEKDGFYVLQRSDEVLPRYTFIVTVAQRAWAQSHRDTVIKYLTALSQGVDWLYNPANKQAAIDILKNKISLTEDVAAKTYEIYVEKGQGRILTKGAKIDMEGLKNSADVLQSLGMIKSVVPEQWVDLSYGSAVK
jgi:ABC-type nitrate/sulfonate/bicarbonate transport system substrate-binding protein